MAYVDDKDRELLPFEIDQVKKGDKKVPGTEYLNATIVIKDIEGATGTCAYTASSPIEIKNFPIEGKNVSTTNEY